jgi:hypothetical protein
MTTEPISEEAFTGRGFAVDDRLWMADWEVEFADRRQYENRLYGEGIVDEIMKEAYAAPRCSDATFLGPARAAHYSYSNACKEVDEKMDEITRQKMANYLELFDAIKAKISNEQIAITVLQEVAKDVRSDRRSEEHEANNSQPASERQKKFMKKLGIKYPADVTKLEASAMIDEELGKNGNNSD